MSAGALDEMQKESTKAKYHKFRGDKQSYAEASRSHHPFSWVKGQNRGGVQPKAW